MNVMFYSYTSYNLAKTPMFLQILKRYCQESRVCGSASRRGFLAAGIKNEVNSVNKMDL